MVATLDLFIPKVNQSDNVLNKYCASYLGTVFSFYTLISVHFKVLNLNLIST